MHARPQGDAAAAGQAGACWASLPGDVLLLVEAHLVASKHDGGAEQHLGSMRAACSSWRQSLATAPADLRPLGKPAALPAFPRAVSLDYAARGAGQSLTDAELVAACTQLGPWLESLDISGAFQLSSTAVQAALARCATLRHLAADGSTLQDAAFAGLAQPQQAASAEQPGGSGSAGAGSSRSGAFVLPPGPLPLASSSSCVGGIIAPPLQCLESLSLRGCLFLRGGLLADLAAGCPVLASLDLAGCSLSFNLNPDVAAPLSRMRCLQRLILDSNGVDDAAMQHIAVLQQLRELSMRSSTHLSDASLYHLAQLRGSRLAAVGAINGTAGGIGSSSSGSGDKGLVSLDISGCSALTDQCWLAVTEMQGLTSLRLEHMAHLLQHPSMPEGLPAALWRLPRLRSLSLAGSCCHPTKLKLLGTTCGCSITHLDIGVGGAYSSYASGAGSSGGGGSSSSSGGSGGGGMPSWASAAVAPGVPQQAAGPAYRRLTSLHERDLCEAAQSFRTLHSFCAAGSALPLRVCTAFLAAAPAARLACADLRGCCLDAEPPAAAAMHSTQPPWQQQLFFSSGARRALNFDSYSAVTGTSPSRMHHLHAEADSWQRPATAGRFAVALRRQAPSLACLRLGGASGVTDRHLSSLPALSALSQLDLAGTGGAVSAVLMSEVATGCPFLQLLDIGGTAADDAALAALAPLCFLRQLAAAGCTRIGGAGVSALVSGPASRQLRWLDLNLTEVDDGALGALAASCRQLSGLNLTGCRQLSPAGVDALCALPTITCLGLGRCPQAVTDAGLLRLAGNLPRLTWLNLSEVQQVTSEGLAAALLLLPCLAHCDLTAAASRQLQDDRLVLLLSGSDGAPATPANIQLPQGSTSPTGSPFKRRGALAAVPA